MNRHGIRKTFLKSPLQGKGCFRELALDVHNSGMVWAIAKRTAPLCAVKGALDNGVNISVWENHSKWLVFSDPVTYIMDKW